MSMTTRTNMRDATEELTLYIKDCHILNAKRRDRKSCTIALSGKDQHDIEDISVDRNIIKIKFVGQKQWVRYAATPSARSTIIMTDREHLKNLHRMGILNIPEQGFPLTLRPPRWGQSLARSRNPSHRRKKGTSNRAYSKPVNITMEDIRHGQGFKD